MGINASILGCSGHHLTQSEKSFFSDVQPWGFILFGRNIDNPDQVKKLVQDLKDCVSHDPVPILIDQEGGRVRRLRPPHWENYGSGDAFGRQYAISPERGRRMAWLQSRLMAMDLLELGINVDCLPVLDVPVAGSHDVIGDRAYSKNPQIVADIGKAASNGLLDGGVLPVIKHIPGHGRAGVDSHQDLPIVNDDIQTLEEMDFAPFVELNTMPLAMTAHVVYSQIDDQWPATSSKAVIDKIIRGHIGFDGLLMCDDLAMHALSGDFSQRTQRAFASGCDTVLHCNGNMAEMREVAENSPELSGKALLRAQSATNLIGQIIPSDRPALRDEYDALCYDDKHQADPTEVGGRLA